MKISLERAILFILLCFIAATNTVLYAEPWYTGPIFAQAGKTIPKGDTVLQPYFFDTFIIGHFDKNGNVTHIPSFRTVNPILAIYHGLTDILDCQIIGSYDINSTLRRTYTGFADTNLGLGIQLLEQSDSWKPNLRFVLNENFPTGKYDNFDPKANGVEGTGFGSYQTVVGLDFQLLKHYQKEHYLRSRLNLYSVFSSKVSVHGFNIYGGGINSKGTVHPGPQYIIDLSFEYSLTQNWVPVMEFLYQLNQKTTFNGEVGTTLTNEPAFIGNNASQQFSIAPALEYNFSKDLGVIVGLWITLAGKNSNDLISGVISINYFL
ncbi:Fe-S protein [Legionella santicrucis]|uniref:Fe-S protein n=1 Tax=Legionella santicrucis TaxID=45074 RepID=A0A0W0YJ75_9GAMM|nr:transporter [Legionella santicrucis]KTD56972.1 Fe-S protein [Legionella santicrucis]